MLRNERPRLGEDLAAEGPGYYRVTVPETRELFIGEPAAFKGHAYAISGWPNWLIPAYQLKGHRPTVRLLEEER
jgi:hypothetical protein